MPLVKMLRSQLVGCVTRQQGEVVTLDPKQAESFVKAGAAVVVPPGTESEPPEHEKATAPRSPEKAAGRSK